VSIIATGFGLVSPVGHSAAATCAAVRAGISNFVELESMMDREGESVVASVLKPTPLHEEPFGPALQAAREAISACGMSLHSERVVISILGPEDSKEDTRLLREPDVELLARALGLGASEAVFYRDGNAGGFRAMCDVQRRLERNPKSVELVLGIDSLVGLRKLAYLERRNRLKGRDFPRGLIPGEACACVVFQETANALMQPGQGYMRLVSAQTTTETAVIGSDSPCLAEGLTGAIQAALDRAGWTAADVGQVYCDLNGEAYRAHEWMLALCRCLDNPHVAHPADCVADVGAAFGPLLLCQAAMALRRGYARGDRAIAFCSSDGGLRACVCLDLVRA
jgi:3-oxoacyl-[acyl-carrier-protein] synthase-1